MTTTTDNRPLRSWLIGLFPAPLAHIVANYSRPTKEDAMRILATREPSYSFKPSVYDVGYLDLSMCRKPYIDHELVRIDCFMMDRDSEEEEWHCSMHEIVDLVPVIRVHSPIADLQSKIGHGAFLKVTDAIKKDLFAIMSAYA
jgi:hypothetical protein